MSAWRATKLSNAGSRKGEWEGCKEGRYDEGANLSQRQTRNAIVHLLPRTLNNTVSSEVGKIGYSTARDRILLLSSVLGWCIPLSGGGGGGGGGGQSFVF